MPAQRDSALRKSLVKEIFKARQQIQELSTQIVRHQGILQGAEKLYRAKFGELPPEGVPLPAPRKSSEVVHSKARFADLPVRKAAEIVLAEYAHPLTAREIHNYLARGGKTFSGATPIEAVRTTLKKYPGVFKKLSDGRWTLTDQVRDRDLVAELLEK